MHLFLICMCCGLCASDQLQRGLEKHFYGLLGCFFLIYYFLCPERKWYFPSLFSASNPPIRDSPYLGKTPTFNKVRRSVERIYFRFLHSLPSSPWFSPTQGWHYQLETFISPFPFTSNSAHWPQHLCPFLPLWAGDPPKKPLTHRLL